MYNKYHLKTKKKRKQNDKKKGGAKKPSKKSKKTRKNIKGGKAKISKNDVTISIDEDPVTKDDMMFIGDKKFKWTCSNGEINEDNGKKDFDCKIKPLKKKFLHRVTGKKYNRNENITRRIAVGAEYKPGGMDLVLQNYKSDNKLDDKYWDCGCKTSDKGAVDEDGDIDLDCFCDVLGEMKDGEPAVERWAIDNNDEDDELSDSEDENDDYDDFVSMPSEIDAETENEEEKLENLKKELDDLEEEWERCQESGFGDPKFCSKVKRDLEARKRQMKGGGVKNTKKSKLSKLKSLIKDYERVIKKYSNKLIKFKSKEVSKDKSSKKSKKVSKGKSLKKSKKYTKKNTKK
jgi:hypothetical protein